MLSSFRQTGLRNRLTLLQAYFGGAEPAGASPTAAYIEATSRCNLQCPMCARQLADETWRDHDMTLEEFDRALAALAPECELVLPFAGGEPLLHPDVAEHVARCARSGRKTELATNATLLDGRRGRDLLLAGLDTLVISVDAARASTYERIRRGADLERTKANISRFLRLKRELRAKTWVVLQMVSLPENRDEVAAFRDQWSRLRGVDVVRVKADEVNVQLVRRGAQGRGVGRLPCHFPWLGPLLIRHDGAVYPCCHSWRGEPVGHVDDQDLRSIWNGEAMRTLREAHRAADLGRFPACRDCQAVVPHPALIAGSLLTPTYITRRAIPFVESVNRHVGRALIRG